MTNVCVEGYGGMRFFDFANVIWRVTWAYLVPISDTGRQSLLAEDGSFSGIQSSVQQFGLFQFVSLL